MIFSGLIDLISLISIRCFCTPHISSVLPQVHHCRDSDSLIIDSYLNKRLTQILFPPILFPIADSGLPDLPTGNRIQTAHMQPLSRSSSSSRLVTVNGDGNGRSRV